MKTTKSDNPKHNPLARRRMRPILRGPMPWVPCMREAFVPSTNEKKATRPKVAYKPTPFDVTAFQDAAHKATVDAPHVKSAKRAEKKGHHGGIPKRLRKYPNGKHAVEVPA